MPSTDFIINDHVTSTNETATLNYLQWKDDFNFEKPYEVLSEVPEGCKRKNFTVQGERQQTIYTLRGRQDEFNLDDNGFEIRKSQLNVSSFNEVTIERDYLPDVSALLQTIEPGAEVHIFDWRLRSSDKTRVSAKAGARLDLNDPMLILEPVHAVHNGRSEQSALYSSLLIHSVDQSPSAAIKRVKHHLGERAEGLLKRRFRIINVWRPLRLPIENFPLALCDGSTVPETSLIQVDHVRKNYVGESLYPLYSEGLKWYFLDRQTKDEVLVFKTFDSSKETKAKCCPHTSFHQSSAKADHNPRETIEVRALVFSKE